MMPTVDEELYTNTLKEQFLHYILFFFSFLFLIPKTASTSNDYSCLLGEALVAAFTPNSSLTVSSSK